MFCAYCFSLQAVEEETGQEVNQEADLLALKFLYSNTDSTVSQERDIILWSFPNEVSRPFRQSNASEVQY